MSSELVPTKQTAGDALIAMIATAAQTSSIEIDKLKELMEMRREILAHEAEIAFNIAMNAAQADISPVTKDGENPHAHSRYATLEKVDREIRPIYTKHGFSLTFNTGTPAQVGAVHVICEVRHSGGHKKEYFLEGDLDVSGAQGKSNKTSIQGLGSSVSYLRRYLTLMIFNVTLTNEDNDGAGDRQKYDAMRQQADNRQAARKAAEQATAGLEAAEAAYQPEERPVFNDEPGLQPPHYQELRDSIKEFGVRPTKRNPSKFDMLDSFRGVKKLFAKIKRVDVYYSTLGDYGAVHSSDFPDTPGGIEQARQCYKEMSLAYGKAKAEVAKQELCAWARKTPHSS